MLPPYRIVTLQLVATLVAAGALWPLSLDQAGAALLAGVACVVPAGYFAWRTAVERSPSRLLFQGVARFVLTAVLLAVFIVGFTPAPAGFFGTFIVLQLAYVIGPLLLPER